MKKHNDLYWVDGGPSRIRTGDLWLVKGLLPRSTGDQNELLRRFKDFQMVDLRRSRRTAYKKVWFIKGLLKTVDKNPAEISREDLRAFLRSLEKYSAATYKNTLMALKVFFRDYMEKPELVYSIKFPHQVFKPKK